MAWTVDEAYCTFEFGFAAAVRALVYEGVRVSYSDRDSSSEFLRVARRPNSGKSLYKRALSVVDMAKRPDVHFRLNNRLIPLLFWPENNLCHVSNHPFCRLGTISSIYVQGWRSEVT